MKTLHLEIIGQKFPDPSNTGSPLRLFSPEAGTYSISFNDFGEPILKKTFRDPISISYLPYFDMKYVIAMEAGHTLLIDTDIVRLIK